MSARHLRRLFIRHQAGTTAIEFALVSPILIVLLFGIVTFGWAMHCIHTVGFALERSGRAFQLNPSLTQTQLEAMVKSDLQGIGDPEVTVTVASDDSIPDITAARLTATYVFEIRVPLLPAQSITYTTSVTVPLSADLG